MQMKIKRIPFQHLPGSSQQALGMFIKRDASRFHRGQFLKPTSLTPCSIFLILAPIRTHLILLPREPPPLPPSQLYFI